MTTWVAFEQFDVFLCKGGFRLLQVRLCRGGARWPGGRLSLNGRCLLLSCGSCVGRETALLSGPLGDSDRCDSIGVDRDASVGAFLRRQDASD